MKEKSFLFVMMPVIILATAFWVFGCDDRSSSDSDDDDNDDSAVDDDANDDDADDDDATDDDAGPTRSFLLSAAPMQYEMGEWSITTIFDTSGFSGLIDILSVHIDGFFGLPWEEFAAGEEPPAAWVAIMTDIRQQAQELGVDIFLSLIPLDGTRGALTPLAHEEGGELVIDSDGFNSCFDFNQSPDAQKYRQAYKNYVRWMVEFFQPTYLNHLIEMNIFAHSCPDEYDSLIDLADEVYEQEKTINPALVIFPSFVMSFYWGFGDDGECSVGDRTCFEASMARDANIKRDRFGVSSYPVFSSYEWTEMPADYYSAINDYTDDVIVFAEIGTGSQPVIFPYPTLEDDCFEFLILSEAEQSAFMQRLFEEAQSFNTDLLVWWSLRDFLPDSVLGKCPCQAPDLWCILYDAMYDVGLLPAWLMWGAMGIMDYDYNPKPAMDVWQDWLAKPVAQ